MHAIRNLPGWIGLVFGSSPSGAHRGLLPVWYRRSIQRRQLAELEPRLLKDIGVTQTAADFESSKPFWVA